MKGNQIRIPARVQKEAKRGLKLLKLKFRGGSPAGWKRGQQLAQNKVISLKDLAAMRTWFARHGPDAQTGGTSYPGYCRWLNQGEPTDEPNSHRGAVAWLLWGGDAAYLWLKEKKIRATLRAEYPTRKEAPIGNRLACCSKNPFLNHLKIKAPSKLCCPYKNVPATAWRRLKGDLYVKTCCSMCVGALQKALRQGTMYRIRGKTLEKYDQKQAKFRPVFRLRTRSEIELM